MCGLFAADKYYQDLLSKGDKGMGINFSFWELFADSQTTSKGANGTQHSGLISSSALRDNSWQLLGGTRGSNLNLWQHASAFPSVLWLRPAAWALANSLVPGQGWIQLSCTANASIAV